MTAKTDKTKYVLRLVDFNSPESDGKSSAVHFPVIFETQKKKLLDDYMRAFFPNHKHLPIGTGELHDFFSQRKPNGLPSKRFLDLRVTPYGEFNGLKLNPPDCLTYIEVYSVD